MIVEPNVAICREGRGSRSSATKVACVLRPPAVTGQGRGGRA